jgi:hypothetical protein
MNKIEEIIQMLRQISNTDHIDAIFWFVKRLLG